MNKRKLKAFSAVAYARFSSSNQREESIDAQLRAINEYCDRNGFDLIEAYTDEAVSGKTADRDSFQRMISDLLDGTVVADVVFVHKFNRFARNKFDSAIYKKRLKDKGIRVISVTQNIDDSPEGAMLESFLETMDEYFSANLSQETQKGIRENAMNGKHNGGRVTLGYTVNEKGKYELNDAAPVALRIFEMYAAGISKIKICDILNGEGLRNQYGRPFNQRTVKYMMQNEKYIGNHVFTLNGKETVRHDGIIPVIVDRDLWEKVQAVNASMVKRKTRSEMPTYLLTGKMFCAGCGAAFVGGGGKIRDNGINTYSYRCKGRTTLKNGCEMPLIRKTWVEKAAFDAICDEVFTPEKITEICKKAYSEIVTNAQKPLSSISALKAEQKSLLEMEQRLAKLYAMGKITDEAIDAEADVIIKRKAQIEGEIQSMQAVAANELTLKDMQRFFFQFVDDMKKSESADDETFRQIVFSSFLDAVYVGENTVRVRVMVNFNEIKKGGDKRQNAPAFYRLPLLHFNDYIDRPNFNAKINKPI